MKNLTILSIVASVIVVLIVFWPSTSSEPLCGPVCSGFGLSFWEKECIGIETKFTAMDYHRTTCWGITGEKKCYGKSYFSAMDDPVEELDCNYPCSNATVMEYCQDNVNISASYGQTFPCEWINKQCDTPA